MSESVDDVLDRCEDVLTDWRGSGDAMRAVGYDVVDTEGYHFRFDRTPLPAAVPVAVPEIEYDREAYVAALRAAFRDITEAFRPIVDGIALRQCREGAELAGIIIDDPLPEDPRERALHLRQHRNTGPQPYRLDGRRKR